MDEVLDQPVLQTDEARVKYGGFWQRFGALFLDLIILSPVSIGVTYLNISGWKSPLIMIIVNLIGVGYKPFMEFTYGATWGKMALNLKVTNLAFEKPDLKEILLRNVFHIAPSLVSIAITIGLYNDPEFSSVTGLGDFSTFTQKSVILQINTWLSGTITIIDAIVLVADQKKRSWHDRIGGTVVIEKP